MFRKSLVLIFIFSIFNGFGQNYSYKKKYTTQQGAVYFLWGYNRSAYTRSNINFYGSNYNFTLYNAVAKDRPCDDIPTYFNINTITVPQFNIRLGYYFKPKWDISIGYDHMKYVMQDDQELKITGHIPASENQYLNGIFNGEIVPVSNQTLHYENTNGLNYISIQVTHTDGLYRTKDKNFAIQRRLGFGAGPVLTQTDFTWNNQSYSSTFQFTGYGISAHAAARFEFFNRFFLQTKTSTGFIHLPKVSTIQYSNHYAKHKFMYLDFQIVGGIFFYLKLKGGCGTCPDW